MVIQEMRGCALHWKNMDCRALLNKMTTIDQLSKAVTSVRNSATCAYAALRDDWKKEIEEDYKKRSKKHR